MDDYNISTSMQALQRVLHDTAKEKGWWEGTTPDQRFSEFIALVHSELSEALEEKRAGHGLTEVYYSEDKPGKPEGVGIELADAVIRILDFCEAAGISLVEMIAIKYDYNEGREYRHGKEF